MKNKFKFGVFTSFFAVYLAAQSEPRMTLTRYHDVNSSHDYSSDTSFHWHEHVASLESLAGKVVKTHKKEAQVLINFIRDGLRVVPEKIEEMERRFKIYWIQREIDSALLLDSPALFELSLCKAQVDESLFSFLLKKAIEKGKNQGENVVWSVDFALAHGHKIKESVIQEAFDVAEYKGLTVIIKRLLGERAFENGKYNAWCKVRKFTSLHKAAHRGDLAALKTYIEEHKADQNFVEQLNMQDTHYRTPLYSAAQNGHVELVKSLLENGADPRIEADCDDEEKYPINAAIANGHAAIVKILFPRCNQMHERYEDKLGNHNGGGYGDPLFYAAETGQEECLRVILEHPSTCVNLYAEGWCETALDIAAKKNYLACVRLLLKHGARPDLTSEDENLTTIQHVEKCKLYEETRKEPDFKKIKNFEEILRLLRLYANSEEESESGSEKQESASDREDASSIENESSQEESFMEDDSSVEHASDEDEEENYEKMSSKDDVNQEVSYIPFIGFHGNSFFFE